jgi:hypothetical protein
MERIPASWSLAWARWVDGYYNSRARSLGRALCVVEFGGDQGGTPSRCQPYPGCRDLRTSPLSVSLNAKGIVHGPILQFTLPRESLMGLMSEPVCFYYTARDSNVLIYKKASRRCRLLVISWTDACGPVHIRVRPAPV